MNEEMERFYIRIKLKGYFKYLMKMLYTINHKKCTANKIHHTSLTYIEDPQEELKCKMENQKLQPFNNFTEGQRKALQELAKDITLW